MHQSLAHRDQIKTDQLEHPMITSQPGKLPLSNTAIKAAAKALKTETPRAAVMAALRADAPGHPMDLTDMDGVARPVPHGVTRVRARPGQGALETCIALAQSALSRGRAVTWAGPAPVKNGVPLIDPKAVIHCPTGSIADPDPETVVFADRAGIASRPELSVLAELVKACPHASLVIIDRMTPHGIYLASGQEEGTVITLMEGSAVQPKGIYTQIGEGTMPFRSACLLERHGLDPVCHPDAVEKMISRLTAQPIPETHTERLDMVSRAFGYRSWHAAQGRTA